MNLKTIISVIICMQVLVSNQLLAEYTYTDTDLMSQSYAHAQDHANKQGQYDSESIKYDVGLLRYALKHAYVGRYTIEPEILAEVDHELALIAQTAKSMTGTDLGKSLSKSLAKLPDAHISVWHINQKNYKTKHHKNDKSQILVEIKKNIGSIKDIYVGSQKSKKVVVVKMNEFILSEDKAVAAAYHSFYQKLSKHLLGSHAFILDLRGNHGGNSHYTRELLRVLLDKNSNGGFNNFQRKLVDISSGSLALNQSNLNHFFPENDAAIKKAITGDPAILACTKAIFDGHMCSKEDASRFKKTDKGLWYKSGIEKPYYYANAISASYNRPVYILQDRGTASSSEDFIFLLKSHYPYITTVGDYTCGAINFGDIKYVYLPKTNYILTLPTAIFEGYPRYKDKIGIPPQVHVAKGQDSLAVAIKMIEAFGVESKDFVKKIEKIT